MKIQHTACRLRFVYFIVFIFSGGASGTSISFINDCGFTVWPGISSTPDLNITGFELAKGNSYIVQLPADWQGQIWGRTGCTFNRSGHGLCKTGDCGSGEIACNGRSATPPVTLAQFDLSESQYYDVSLINGYNLPMTVEASGGSRLNVLDCTKAGCVDDLNRRCPAELRLEGGGGCMSACQAFGTQEYCCNNSFSTAGECAQTSYSQLFRSACPRSYASALYATRRFETPYRCEGANYTLRFCPPATTFSTIKVGSQLNSYDQLISIRGKFTLGIFDNRPYDNGSYLGIWYTSDADFRKVWVANRNNPIITASSDIIALSIDPNTGNLIITAGGTTLMNITDVQAGPNPNVTATLEDTGNFQLFDETAKRVLWQSFDHPTNVLLPGMKLGVNKTTGQNWTLTSWLSEQSPQSGAFTLSAEADHEGVQQLVIRRRGQPYWANQYQYLYAMDKTGRKPYYNLTFVHNKDGIYFSYDYDSNYIELPMWILTPEGRITDDDSSVFWTPEFCYGYELSKGCVNSSFPQCRRDTDTFKENSGTFDPGMTLFVEY